MQTNGEVFTSSQAAKFLGMSHSMLIRLSRSGEIPHYWVGKHKRYRKEELEKYIESKRSA